MEPLIRLSYFLFSSSYMPQRPVREILWAREQSESIIFLFQTCAFSGGYFQTFRKELVCLLLIAYSLNSAHFPVFLFISRSQWVISPWPGIQHLISSGEKNNQSFNGANLFQIACSSVSPLKRVIDGIKPGPSGGVSSGAFKSVKESNIHRKSLLCITERPCHNVGLYSCNTAPGSCHRSFLVSFSVAINQHHVSQPPQIHCFSSIFYSSLRVPNAGQSQQIICPSFLVLFDHY